MATVHIILSKIIVIDLYIYILYGLIKWIQRCCIGRDKRQKCACPMLACTCHWLVNSFPWRASGVIVQGVQRKAIVSRLSWTGKRCHVQTATQPEYCKSYLLKYFTFCFVLFVPILYAVFIAGVVHIICLTCIFIGVVLSKAFFSGHFGY